MSTGTLILAFDGLVADTIPIRAEALQQALAQWTEDSTTGPTLERWSAALPGRSLLEAAEQVLGTGDPTRTELVAHRAAQLASDAVRRGVRLTEGIDAFLGAQRTAGVLCVLRADSPRRDVEHVLGMTGLDTAFTIVRCADDPRTHVNSSCCDIIAFESVYSTSAPGMKR